MSDIPYLFDPDAVIWLQETLGLGWPDPWRAIGLLGAGWGILLVVGMSLWFWGRRVAYAVLAVVVVEAALKTVLNPLFSVSRPDATGIVKYEYVGVGSFPSGHVATAAGVWGWVALKGHIGWWLAIAATLLVGISRIYLGVHYFADVVGGIALAGVAIGIVHWVWPGARECLSRLPFWFWMGAGLVAVAGVLAGAIWFFGGNPYVWRAGGMVAGLAIALPLEYHYVRYRPIASSTGRKLAMLAIGVAGIAILAVVDQLSWQVSNSLGAVLMALAALWAMLVAPTIFARLGWSETGESKREERVGQVIRGLQIAAAVLALIVIYGGGIEPRLILETRRHDVELTNLPPSWEGATAAVVADFQVGLWLDNTGMMRRAVHAIVEEDPDLAILAGDFIYKASPEEPGPWIAHIMDILRPLTQTDIPTFAVLGNHDWGLPRPIGEAEPNRKAAEMLRDALTAAGVTVLHNQAVALPARGQAGEDEGEPLYVVGVGSHYMEMDDATTALADLPADAPRITVMHNPSSFGDFPAGTAPLAVAGHTHGGQVRLPFTPAWSYLTFVRDEDVHADGWHEGDFGEEGNRLYVTRGIGMSLVPMRINSPPEVTYFRLRASSNPR